MSNLKSLYSSIDNFKKLGVKINDEVIESIFNVEEEIIKNEILPIMRKAIVPIISQIQRDLMLVIEYSPEKSIELKMIRKKSMKLTEEEEAMITQRKEFKKEVKYTLSFHKKSPKTNLLVTFPSGKTIKNKLAMDTFCEVIEIIGAEIVSSLNIRCCGSNLVSKIKNSEYRQKKTKNDFYIITQTSTKQKKKQLEFISQKLNLGLKITII